MFRYILLIIVLIVNIDGCPTNVNLFSIEIKKKKLIMIGNMSWKRNML